MPQHKFRQTLKKLERKGIKVIEKSEKNTSKVGEKIFALMGLDTHKCSALAFCIKVILQEAHASLRSLLGAMEAREACEREESGQTPRLGRRKPTQMVTGACPSRTG